MSTGPLAQMGNASLHTPALPAPLLCGERLQSAGQEIPSDLFALHSWSYSETHVSPPLGERRCVFQALMEGVMPLVKNSPCWCLLKMSHDFLGTQQAVVASLLVAPSAPRGSAISPPRR